MKCIALRVPRAERFCSKGDLVVDRIAELAPEMSQTSSTPAAVAPCLI